MAAGVKSLPASNALQSRGLYCKYPDAGRKLIHVVPAKEVGELPMKIRITGVGSGTAASGFHNGE
jgi:hypothetical protein